MKLNTIGYDSGLKKKISEYFPEGLASPLPGRKGSDGKPLLYYSGASIIDRLNSTFGHFGWDWILEKEWMEKSQPKIIKSYYDKKLNRKIELNEEDWIIEEQNPVAHVIGKLVVRLQDEKGNIITVTRMAPGSQPVVGGQGEQENAYKGAHTDALKKAATTFGIGLELSRKPIEHEYYEILFGEDNSEIWDDDTKEEYKEYLEFIQKFIEEYELTDEDISNYIIDFSNEELNSLDDITPDNIIDFVDYINELIESIKE